MDTRYGSERTMQFIVEQQAQFWASVQKHDEQIAVNSSGGQAESQMAKHDEQIAHHEPGGPSGAGRNPTWLSGCAGHETRVAEQMQGQEARLASLETKATQLFERMDRFIQGLEGNGHKPQ